MGKLILNGRNYSGLVDAQGVFIDTDNVITSGTYDTSLSYTATEDCFIALDWVNANNNSTKLYINGEDVFEAYQSASIGAGRITLPLKKGQTLTGTTTYSSTKTYTVYGIQMGSEVTFLSEYASACYDTNEREVGCWVDGKPLYQKTLIGTYNSSATSLQIDVSDLDIDKIGNAFLSISSANYMSEVQDYYYSGSDHIRWYYEKPNNNITLEFGNAYPEKPFEYRLTIQYTKTTDVAGSGNWTPTAMPTVHYDDTEKVIGTWFGQTLYEKTVHHTNTQSTFSDFVTITSIANIDTVVSLSGIAHRLIDGVNNLWMDISSRIENSTNFQVAARVYNNDVQYKIGEYGTQITDMYITIQYTKSS